MPEIPYGYCHCGCGEKTNLARDTMPKRGMVKGEPNKFIAGHQSRTDTKSRFWSKVEKRSDTDCWPWMAAVRRPDEGYGAFWLNNRHQPSSRVAWMLTFGDIPEGLQALHKCDNPRCCNPGHLFLGTNLENNADKVAKNRHAFGSKNGFSILTESDVVEIRKLKPDKSFREHSFLIAERFNIKPGTVTDVWRGDSWKHVKI